LVDVNYPAINLDNVEEITKKKVVSILAGTFESQIKLFKDRVKHDFEEKIGGL
jgi:hypothetical protein